MPVSFGGEGRMRRLMLAGAMAGLMLYAGIEPAFGRAAVEDLQGEVI